MIGYLNTFLVLLIGASSVLHLSTPNPVNTPGDTFKLDPPTPVGTAVSGDVERRDEERQSLQKRGEDEEREEELFEDVDPKTLAAVLLEALNHSQVEQWRERGDAKEEEMRPEREEVEEGTPTEGMEGADRDRDGRQKIELLIGAQGKDQQRQEAEERRKAQEEEEKMTERVTSHTTSQKVQVQTQQQTPSPDGMGMDSQSTVAQQGLTSLEQSNKVEEQLSPEELKSLETMMKEFPRLNTATKREGDLEQNQRASRGYTTYNDIIPINKGSKLVMSEKKLKWQEETQKALNIPTFRGGNFMDEFEDNSYAGGDAMQAQPLPEQEPIGSDEAGEENEEALSPEEEEARAKVEQEEMRRQAAEAQRAKMEEEKLADIASDMLLRYMVKQNNGNKKYSSSLSNAAEDKRSNEEQEVMQEDDIDPQTIDKLIEISSKLHLPADDVVEIISDVEKKKRKDVPPESMSRWQQPLMPMSVSLPTNGLPLSQTNQNSSPVSKQSSPAGYLLKTWFQEKSPTRLQNLWSNSAGPKLQTPLSIKQEPRLKPPQSVWTGSFPYPYTYPSYYQRKYYPDYYPIYFPPPPRPKLHYYVPKHALNLKTFLPDSVDAAYTFTPKRRYHSWVQPRLRKPPTSLQQKSYFTGYPLPLYPRRIRPLPIPKPYPPPPIPVIPSQQKQFYYPVPAPAVVQNKDYYMSGKQPDRSSEDNLEKYIQRILLKRPQMLH